MSESPISLDEFNNLHDTAKRIMLNHAFFHQQSIDTEKGILSAYGDKARDFSLVSLLGDIAVIESKNNSGSDDCNFTALVKTDSGWKRTSCFYETAELAALGAMGYKHEGPNSKFAQYAARMLSIEPSHA